MLIRHLQLAIEVLTWPLKREDFHDNSLFGFFLVLVTVHYTVCIGMRYLNSTDVVCNVQFLRRKVVSHSNY